MSFITDLFSGAGSNLLSGVDTILSRFISSPEEKAKALHEISDTNNKFILDQAALAEKAREVELKSVQDELETVTKDRDSARQMNAQLQLSPNASWLSKNVAYCIDIFVSLVWGSLTVFLIARTLHLISTSPQVDISNVLGIYAAVSSAFTLILMYHRGSTVNSRQKDDTINLLSKQP